MNDGIASVPGVLRLTAFSDDGRVHATGCLDAAYPKTTGMRQAMLMLPAGTEWQRLKLKAEMEVKESATPCAGHANSNSTQMVP